MQHVQLLESRQHLTAVSLNMTSGNNAVVMWKDSSGNNRFGPSVGVTYYWDATGSNPNTTGGPLFKFNSTYDVFNFNMGSGNDSFSVDTSVTLSTLRFNISGYGGNDTLWGWNNSDTLDGDEGDDSIVGAGGNDTLLGAGNEDWIDGSSGNDSIDGGDGLDVLLGGNGNDSVRGGMNDNEAELIYGQEGNDTLMAGFGDTMYGNNGLDTLYGIANQMGAPALNIWGYGNALGAGDDGDVDTYFYLYNFAES